MLPFAVRLTKPPDAIPEASAARWAAVVLEGDWNRGQDPGTRPAGNNRKAIFTVDAYSFYNEDLRLVNIAKQTAWSGSDRT
jgi:hypothetical protein